MEVLIHKDTSVQLKALSKHMPHAIGIVGESGIGKYTITQQLVSTQLKVSEPELANYPFYMVIKPDARSIGIESIREINSFLKLKTYGESKIRRFIVIEHADMMTEEAQNAVLKNLEETPDDTVFILTINNLKQLAPTILSRLSILRIKNPTKPDLISFFESESNSAVDIEKIVRVTGYRPGAIHDQITQGSTNSDVIEEVKLLLRSTVFDRLLIINSLDKNKIEPLDLVRMLIRMSDVALSQAIDNKAPERINQWKRILIAAFDAENNLLNKGQVKLVMTNLILEM